MKALAVYNGQHVSDSRDMRLPLLVLALAWIHIHISSGFLSKMQSTFYYNMSYNYDRIGNYNWIVKEKKKLSKYNYN